FVMSRNINAAKRWIKKQTRGTERYGIVASSGAVRLKSIGYNVRASINPVYWFLNPKDDVRSSFYLEDVATEFDVQGLELDWVCLIWDADLRYMAGDWELKYFKGSSWQEVNST
ncbi:DNA/RNA helicase domain-containing protein, partial [Treponema pedis]|uniref:DNA/RNA helicase domain-containing protein n=1 Tax=Treponema pedis TaxID=409322 RepID=UPI00056E2B7B